MTETPQTIDLLTTPEAAALLRRSEETMRWWRSHGRGPTFVKLGSRVAYRRQDLESWLEQRLVDPSTDR